MMFEHDRPHPPALRSWPAIAATLALACTAGDETSASASATASSSTTDDPTTSTSTDGMTATSATTTTTTMTATTSAATTAITTSSESESESDTGVVEVACAATVMTHAEACPTEPCPIVADVEVRCDDLEMGAPGVRVAPTSDRTYVITASSNERIFFAIDADGGEEVDVLPSEFIRETILFAAGPDDGLHAIADGTDAPDYDGGVLHVGDAEGWMPSLVFDQPNKYVPVLDLEVGVDAAPHLWFVADAPDVLKAATRTGKGPWQISDAPAPAGVDWTHFTLTSGGERVGAGFREEGNAWQLRTLIAGVDAPLGGAVDDWFPYVYRLTPAPVPAAPPGPGLAAAIQHADELRVAWPEGDGYAEASIAGTETVTTTCSSEWNDGCPGPCHELGGGVEEGAFAIARASDGDAWLAYVRTHLDVALTYVESCDPEIGCYCNAELGEELSYGVLHLVRVPLGGGPPIEALAQPIGAPATWDFFIGWSDTPRLVDVRAFGDHLGIAVRTADTILGPAAVRVMRVDTTLFGGP